MTYLPDYLTCSQFWAKMVDLSDNQIEVSKTHWIVRRPYDNGKIGTDSSCQVAKNQRHLEYLTNKSVKILTFILREVT